MASLALLIPVRSSEKHPSNPLALEQRFLNFGALALATYCARNGHTAKVYDEYKFSEERLFEAISAEYGHKGPQVIGISCISAYSADRAEALIVNLRELYPDSLIAIGGQHFAGFWKDDFQSMLRGTDLLIGGEAERSTLDVLNLVSSGLMPNQWNEDFVPSNVWFSTDRGILNGKVKPEIVDINEVVNPDFSLYPGSLDLFPSIEFSRGCKYACVFCANTSANRRNFRNASYQKIKEAIENLGFSSARDHVSFYMQASDFVLSSEDAESFAQILQTSSVRSSWRTEIRADEMSYRSLKALKSAGLSYLDIGLESASKSMLKVMRKTPNPDQYLEKADSLLKAATDLGIFTKVNYLIHPGDTAETVEESLSWMLPRKSYINGISSGVTLEYPGTPLSQRLAEFIKEHGTRRRPHELSKWGVFNLDPSSNLTNEDAEKLARSTSQKLQSKSDFIKSKAFGYLGSDVNPEEILHNLPDADHTTPYG